MATRGFLLMDRGHTEKNQQRARRLAVFGVLCALTLSLSAIEVLPAHAYNSEACKWPAPSASWGTVRAASLPDTTTR
jgi:hypothetical protein